MSSRDSFPWKHFCLWILLIVMGLLTAYIVFLGATSVWVGVSNRQQPGFFMPIIAGAVAIVAVLWIFYHLSRYLLGHTKEKGILDR
jgi:uncharacterized membrane protein HdeD (DUF308 family)